MVEVRETLSESHLATPGAVGEIRRSVARYASAAGIVGSKLDDVRLAVSEAASNVARHAYGEKVGQVHVTARVVGGELWVLVADDGAGHNVASEHPGLGWGLALMTNACDEFTLVERAEGGSEARMCFLIPAAATGVNVEDR